jgi:hypothetical protein
VRGRRACGVSVVPERCGVCLRGVGRRSCFLCVTACANYMYAAVGWMLFCSLRDGLLNRTAGSFNAFVGLRATGHWHSTLRRQAHTHTLLACVNGAVHVRCRRGVALSAALFGVLHVGGGRNAAFAAWATGVGALYGGLYLATANLWVPAGAHVFANFASAALWKSGSPLWKATASRPPASSGSGGDRPDNNIQEA